MSTTFTAPLSESQPRTRSNADDSIYPSTRYLAMFVIPFLVVASAILLIFPRSTGELFAWPIQPPMTAMMLGSAYLGGIYFFASVLRAKRWHTIKAGFLPVATFAAMLGIATVLHWDRFNHSHISFWAWAGLYFLAPLLVFIVWLRNRKTDPGIQPGDLLLPKPWRWVFGVVGSFTLLIAVLLFLQPNLMISIWPWKLSPLTARVVGAMFVLPGVLGLEFAIDSRWSAMRRILESQALSILLILISTSRDWGSMNHAGFAPQIFAFGMTALLTCIIGLYTYMQVKSNNQSGH